MFYVKDTYATVWAVEDKGNFVKGRISTSEKDNREEGKYINSNWFVTFVGKAKDKANVLTERDKIKILSGKVTNTSMGEGNDKKFFTNVTIFDFENMTNPNNDSSNNSFYTIPEGDGDELPF